jgi:protein-tyrosine phosphatase
MTVANIKRPVLFICTGNYYRSRTAEILFNHFAARESLPVQAFSRGLRLNPLKNTGIISPHVVPFLADHNIPAGDVGFASALVRSDLSEAGQIIAMDENEHRPMMREKFPDWENKVEYWHLEDDYLLTPDIVLPILKNKVEALFLSVAKRKIASQ